MQVLFLKKTGWHHDLINLSQGLIDLICLYSYKHIFFYKKKLIFLMTVTAHAKNIQSLVRLVFTVLLE